MSRAWAGTVLLVPAHYVLERPQGSEPPGLTSALPGAAPHWASSPSHCHFPCHSASPCPCPGPACSLLPPPSSLPLC